MKSKNSIIHRWYFRGIVRAKTPLLIGSGESEKADIECMRDWSGNFFIPASSLAGVLRAHLSRYLNPDLIKLCFGGEDDESGQSLFYFYDLPLQTTQSYIRDGIAIDSETGTVKEKAKYDYELIPAGTEAPFRLEVMAYERNEIETIENVIDIIIASWYIRK